MNKTAEQLFDENKDYALKIATNFLNRKGTPIKLLPNEVHQAALIGLFEACSKYDFTRNASFKTYSYYRILGAIGDALRDCKWWAKRRNEVPDMTTVGTGSYRPCIDQIEVKQDLNPTRFETFYDPEDHRDELIQVEHRDDFDSALQSLEPSERTFIRQYVLEHLTLSQIGKLNGVSESRMCQKSRAIFKKLKNWAAKRT